MARPAKLARGLRRVPVQLEPHDLELLDLVVHELVARTGAGDRARAVRWSIRCLATQLRRKTSWVDRLIDLPMPPD